jgi:hypothetical protein
VARNGRARNPDANDDAFRIVVLAAVGLAVDW